MNSRRLRVCHMIGSLRYGGAERQFVNLLNHLPDAGKYALILDDDRRDGLGELLGEDVVRRGIGLRLRYAPYYVWKIAGILKDWRVDVLHSHMYWPNLYGSLAATLASVPVFVTSEHGKNPWKKFHHRWIERNVISRAASKRICVSEDILQIRRDIDGIPEEQLIYMPNGTEVPALKPHTPGERPVIGTLGRFVAAKDYLTLIRSAGIIKSSGLDFTLYILGDGSERKAMENEIQRLGLEHHVKTPGFQSDIEGWLSRFDIFVMSSKREGQPMALLEAMANGLPVVSTRVGGIPETLEEGKEGLLVEPEDPQALADALLTLMRDAELRARFGEQARIKVEQSYSVQSVAMRYMQLYKKLLTEK